MLNDSRLPAVIRQHPVQLRSGIRRLDLALPRAKLGIEGHSRRHHFGQENDTSDTLRDLQLAAAGWEVIYVTWKLAHQPNLLVDLIVDTYEQRRALLANAA
jgi:very-short-patch-repair endonuclease